MHRAAIWAHVAMGNSSGDGAGEKARDAPKVMSGTFGNLFASRESAGFLRAVRVPTIAIRNAVRKSSGRWLFTYVPSPLRPSRYPSECNCSNAITALPRETPYCFASSRVAGRREPRLSRPLRMASRISSYSHRQIFASGGGSPKGRSRGVAAFAIYVMVHPSSPKWTFLGDRFDG